MIKRVPNSVLRRVRDMLRRGDLMADIAAACNVDKHVVEYQYILISKLDGPRPAAGKYVAAGHKRAAQKGKEFDAYDVDLVDIFATPRTPRQIRRAMNGTGE